MWLWPTKKLMARVPSQAEYGDLRVLVRACTFPISCDAAWEAGLESGVNEVTKNFVANYIAGQIWGVGMNYACAAPKYELSPHTCSLVAWAVGLPNGKPRQDWSQSASFQVIFGIMCLAFGGGPRKVLGKMGITCL